MNNIHNIVVVAVAVCLIVACDNTQEPEPPAICHGLQEDEHGIVFTDPSRGFAQGAVSIDGKLLAAQGTGGRIFLIDLQTESQTELRLQGLPENVRFVHFSKGVSWCPYDSRELLVVAYTHTDTSATGDFVGAQNAYTMNVNGQVINRVTPSIYPYWGSTTGGLASPHWLNGSTALVDSIHLTSGIYIPQQQELIDTPYEVITPSQDGRHWFGWEIGDNDPKPVIDGILFTLEGYPPEGFLEASFSPSGKYLALSGWSSHATLPINTPNIWIIDMEKFQEDPSQPLAVVSAINTQREFCMFTFSVNPVFLTDSTLVIDMFEASGANNGYHEIGINGSYIRKLTKPY